MSLDKTPRPFPPEVRAFLSEVAEEVKEQLAKKRKEQSKIPETKGKGESE